MFPVLQNLALKGCLLCVLLASCCFVGVFLSVQLFALTVCMLWALFVLCGVSETWARQALSGESSGE